MFEMFTDKARNAMSIAQSEARLLGQLYVGTEHLLLGLIKEKSGIAAQALLDLHISYEEARDTIKGLNKNDTTEGQSGGHIPFTPRCKRVLEDAYRETMSRGDNCISTEHLLLGIIREGNGVAMDVLLRLGVSPEAVRTKVEKLIEATPPSNREKQRGNRFAEAYVGEGSRPDAGASKTLEHYGRNLTRLASQKKLDPVIGRKNEITRMMQILARRQKNNPLILGDPGVGKTALAEGLAELICSGEVPEQLRGKQIWMLDVAAMVAGSKYRGQFEERMKSAINEAIENPENILFIDEMHTLIGAGSSEGSIDAASMLKPPLSRGELQIIGATTAEEYRKYIEKDSAFERRFQPVLIGEPSCAETLQILEGLKDRYEAHHKVTYTEEALYAAATLSDRYIQDRFLPDKAIDVIDEAGARMRVKNLDLPPELGNLDRELAQVHEDKRKAIKMQDFENAAYLRDEEDRITQKIQTIEKQWKEDSARKKCVVTEQDIAEVVSDIADVPVANLTEEESSKLLRAEEVLHERVIGQEEAVSAIAKAIRRSRSPLKDPRRPGGSFIFLGPSGVGKTELAKSLAEFLFGSEDALISFDMSEFKESISVSKLVGAPPGYVGYSEGGKLTKQVRRRPYSVILFDEIEKAHPAVFDLFLQILDEGHLTDATGRKVDFSNTVVIMTSNIGAREIATTNTFGFSQSSEGLSNDEIKSRVLTELKRQFRPEFLNRVDEIVVFHTLTRLELRRIIDLMVRDLSDRLGEHGISIELSDAARDLVAKKGTDPVYGARPLRRAIQSLIEDRLAEELLRGRWTDGDLVFVDADTTAEKLVFTKKKGIPSSMSDRIARLGRSKLAKAFKKEKQLELLSPRSDSSMERESGA